MTTLTEQDAYQLISDLEQYNQQRYTKLSSDQSAYLTILRTYTTAAHAREVFYIIVVCPVFTEYTPEEIENVSFYQVYMNPSTTQLKFTPLADAIPLSYGVFRSSVFVSYQNENIPLLFTAPYVSSRQLPSLKETILNLFAFPTHMVLLYDSMFLQLNYIPTDSSQPQAYQVTLKGMYEAGMTIGSQSITLLDYFDFNKTMVLLDMFTNPCLVLNNQTMRIGNNQPYLYNPDPASPLEMVVGFNYNYLTDNSPSTSSGVVNQMTREDGKRTLNLQGTTEIPRAQSLSYTSLASIVPLSAQDHIAYFLSGISALNYKYQPLSGQAGWAVVQVSNIFNSNSVVTSSSFALLYSTTRAGLTQYKSTSLWYSLDASNQTLTVWQDPDPATPSFLSYLLENKSTIALQDVVQFPDHKFQEIVTDHEKRMGCKWYDAPCIKAEIRAAWEYVQQKAREAAAAAAAKVAAAAAALAKKIKEEAEAAAALARKKAEEAAKATREAAEKAAKAIQEAAEKAAQKVKEAAEAAAEKLLKAKNTAISFAQSAFTQSNVKKWAEELKNEAINIFNQVKDVAKGIKDTFNAFIASKLFEDIMSVIKVFTTKENLQDSAIWGLFPYYAAFRDFKNSPDVGTFLILIVTLATSSLFPTLASALQGFATTEIINLLTYMYNNNMFGFQKIVDEGMSELLKVLQSVSF